MTLLDDRPVPAGPTTPAPPGRGPQVATRVAVAVAVVLLATALALWQLLPDVAVAEHWSVAWAGLDVATATAACALAVGLRAGDRRAALVAAAGAALLVVDAWFDVATATAGTAQTVAVLEAVLLELPLAVLAGRLAVALLGPLRADDTARSW